MKLEDIKFLHEVADDLVLHANKYGMKLKRLATELEEKKLKALERSKKAVYEGRQKNKDYAKSRKQLEYKKQVKVLENEFEDLK